MEKATVLGFNGPKGAGKDTSAALVTESLWDSSRITTATFRLTDPIRAAIESFVPEFFDPDDPRDLNDQEVKLLQIPIGSQTMPIRDFMVTYGRVMREIDPYIFAGTLARSIEQYAADLPDDIILVPDVRFSNDLAMLDRNKFDVHIIHVVRPDHSFVGAIGGYIEEAPFYVLDNSSTLDALLANVDKMCEDLELR